MTSGAPQSHPSHSFLSLTAIRAIFFGSSLRLKWFMTRLANVFGCHKTQRFLEALYLGFNFSDALFVGLYKHGVSIT